MLIEQVNSFKYYLIAFDAKGKERNTRILTDQLLFINKYGLPNFNSSFTQKYYASGSQLWMYRGISYFSRAK